MSTCQYCGVSEVEYDTAQGTAFCVKCGTVLEENTIVAEVGFLDAANGAAIAAGGFVSAENQGRTSRGNFGKYKGQSDSREQTIRNARITIQRMAHALKLNENHVEAAQRYYNLALINNFTKGRKILNVAAACLYIVCRLEKTSHMLIDFSDVLSTSVFTLGNLFLKLVKELNVKLPLIDPSLYISRFAAMLEFGDKTHIVANDALRLVQRMSRDWINLGRRPAGICGACLLIAARMHNFKRTIKEVIHVVRMAEITVRKRLLEFKATASASLSVEDFQTIWLETGENPPAFKSNREKEAISNHSLPSHHPLRQSMVYQANETTPGNGNSQENVAHEEEEEEMMAFDDEDEDENEDENKASSSSLSHLMKSDKNDQDFSNAILAVASLAKSSQTNEEENGCANVASVSRQIQVEQAEEKALEDQVVSILSGEELKAVSEELAKSSTENTTLTPKTPYFSPDVTQADQKLDELDQDEELANILLTPEEAEMKSKIWHELNRDYLLEQQFKLTNPKQKTAKPRTKKKKSSQNANLPAASSAAEAVKQSIVKKLSKKINYNALDQLFDSRSDHRSRNKSRSQSRSRSRSSRNGSLTPRRSRERSTSVSSVRSHRSTHSGFGTGNGSSIGSVNGRLGGLSSLMLNHRRGSSSVPNSPNFSLSKRKADADSSRAGTPVPLVSTPPPLSHTQLSPNTQDLSQKRFLHHDKMEDEDEVDDGHHRAINIADIVRQQHKNMGIGVNGFDDDHHESMEHDAYTHDGWDDYNEL